MDRTPDWTRDEFELLIRHPRLTEVELKDVVPGHSGVPVAIVREGVHSWHQGCRHTTLLSAHDALAQAVHEAIPVCRLITDASLVVIGSMVVVHGEHAGLINLAATRRTDMRQLVEFRSICPYWH